MNTEHTTPQLSFDELRVLGVLIEKAYTVPASYPMTINAIVTGCNQKSNRDPVVNFNDERIEVALEDLQAKGFTREVHDPGSRTLKFRHITREALAIDARQLIILTELMLRGPQTVGELRQRASRMQPIDSMDTAQNILDALINREAGSLVQELPPAPGSRAKRYAQLLSPGAHPLNAPPNAATIDSPTTHRTQTPAPTTNTPSNADLLERIEALERRINTLESQLGV
ncbi:MAG: YceH family protein [Phycisphaerales bacterium]